MSSSPKTSKASKASKSLGTSEPQILPAFIPPCPAEHFFSLDDPHKVDLCASYFGTPNLCQACYGPYKVMVRETYDRMIEEQKALIKQCEEDYKRLEEEGQIERKRRMLKKLQKQLKSLEREKDWELMTLKVERGV